MPQRYSRKLRLMTLPLIAGLLSVSGVFGWQELAWSDSVVRTFHIGNSGTDTINKWLQPLAESAGRQMDYHRFTIPGAPTSWLWNHPGTGFGDNRYPQAFKELAPIDHLFTQPAAGHSRSIENEAEYSGKFFELSRESSPEIQMWIYSMWPSREFNDNWAQAKHSASKLGLEPARTWEEAAANHLAYAEAVRERLDAEQGGKSVRIVPAGLALARLKEQIESGNVPGMTDFFAEIFKDQIHLKQKGRYFVALVFYSCIFGDSPEDKVGLLSSGLTAEQARIFQQVAWESVKDYRWSGVTAPGAAVDRFAMLDRYLH